MQQSLPIKVYLVCNARYHDTNFARLELLKLLAEDEDIHTHVAEDFSDTEAIKQCSLLITYTCDLRPTAEEQVALAEFLDAGGRWFALHATKHSVLLARLTRSKSSRWLIWLHDTQMDRSTQK